MVNPLTPNCETQLHHLPGLDIQIDLETQSVVLVRLLFLAQDPPPPPLLLEWVKFTIQYLGFRLFFVLAKLPSLSVSQVKLTKRSNLRNGTPIRKSSPLVKEIVEIEDQQYPCSNRDQKVWG
jgi:hypothetical protein